MRFKLSDAGFICIILSVTATGFTRPTFAGPMRHVSESSLHVSRYVEATPGPTEAQFNPLHIVIPRVRFENQVKSVGQAIHVLLIDTGYRLARFHPDKRFNQVLKLPLPDIHRNMGPLTLEQALKTLVSRPWLLSVDPIHRLVSYELPDLYRQPSQTTRNPSKKPAVKSHPAPHKSHVKQTSVSKQTAMYSWNDVEQIRGDIEW